MPPDAVPEEVTDVEVAVPAAVDRPPKEDNLTLPLFRDEVRIGQQVVKDVGVQDGLVRQLLAELVALDPFAVLLAIVKVKRDLDGVPLERTALPVLLNRPAVGDKRLRVAVDDVLGGDDFRVADIESDLTYGSLLFCDRKSRFLPAGLTQC